MTKLKENSSFLLENDTHQITTQLTSDHQLDFCLSKYLASLLWASALCERAHVCSSSPNFGPFSLAVSFQTPKLSTYFSVRSAFPNVPVCYLMRKHSVDFFLLLLFKYKQCLNHYLFLSGNAYSRVSTGIWWQCMRVRKQSQQKCN